MILAPTLLADVVLVVMTLQGVWLVLRRRDRAIDVVAALAPGFFLALAVRSALAEAPWTHVALALALSGPAHLFDMGRRGLYARAGDEAPQTTPRARRPEMSASE